MSTLIIIFLPYVYNLPFLDFNLLDGSGSASALGSGSELGSGSASALGIFSYLDLDFSRAEGSELGGSELGGSEDGSELGSPVQQN